MDGSIDFTGGMSSVDRRHGDTFLVREEGVSSKIIDGKKRKRQDAALGVGRYCATGAKKRSP
ncbi:MAG: hypothetical protein JWM42_394, partial [Burkholderia sp.]|nr:hypothetical protein [Burkholderia sp.]